MKCGEVGEKYRKDLGGGEDMKEGEREDGEREDGMVKDEGRN